METRTDWMTRTLPIVAMVAFLVVAASTEYALAHDVMKLPWPVAVGVPVAIDCYVVAAFRAGKDVRLAMVITAASLAAATGWHMATAGTDDWARFALAGLVLMLLVVVLWRVHVISGHAPAGPVTDPIDPGPLVQVRTETVTVTATRSVAYLPATYVRTIESGRSTHGSTRPQAIGSPIRTPIESDPIRSIDSIGSVPSIEAPIRSAPRSTRPDPIRSTPIRSDDAPWIRRSRIGSDRSDGALLADFRAALADDPIPPVEAIRVHYRISPARARALRDAIKTDRQQRAAGGVEGEIN